MLKRITPAQIRGARAMLGWSIVDLAKAANVSVSTVKRIESGGSQPVSEAIQVVVWGTLEVSGVLLLDDDGSGPGVRLRVR